MAWPFGSSDKPGDAPSDLSEERLRVMSNIAIEQVPMPEQGELTEEDAWTISPGPTRARLNSSGSIPTAASAGPAQVQPELGAVGDEPIAGRLGRRRGGMILGHRRRHMTADSASSCMIAAAAERCVQNAAGGMADAAARGGGGRCRCGGRSMTTRRRRRGGSRRIASSSQTALRRRTRQRAGNVHGCSSRRCHAVVERNALLDARDGLSGGHPLREGPVATTAAPDPGRPSRASGSKAIHEGRGEGRGTSSSSIMATTPSWGANRGGEGHGLSAAALALVGMAVVVAA